MQKARLVYIDNLRILLITLVIMVHLSITYGGVGSWYYNEGGADTISSVILTWHNAVCQAFFMGFLFFIAGYFTPASYERKGPRWFMKDRLLRLGIPMLCYDFVINPLLICLLFRVGVYNLNGSYRQWLAGYFSTFHIGTGPLWFVEALLIFSGFYVLWRVLGYNEKIQPWTIRPFPKNISLVLCSIAIGVVTFVIRLWLPVGWAFGPLNLQFPFFPQYICMFIVGIVACRNNWLEQITDTTAGLWLIVTLILVFVLFPVLFVFGGAVDGDVSKFIGGFHWQSFAYSVWEQIICVGVIISFLALFRKRLNSQSRLTKAASDSAYAAYVIHAPIIILLAVAVRGVQLFPLAKFALMVIVCVPLSFAIGYMIRSLPLAKRIL